MRRLAFQHGGQDRLLLFFRSEVAEHQDLGEVSDDRRFVLKVVMQAKSLGREVLADDRHREVSDILAAILFRQSEPKEPSLVGARPHLAQQRFPFVTGQTTMFEIGARPFAAVIEEAVIVVLLLQRNDFLLDESVDLYDQVLDILRNCEVHGPFLRDVVARTLALYPAEGARVGVFALQHMAQKLPCVLTSKASGRTQTSHSRAWGPGSNRARLMHSSICKVRTAAPFALPGGKTAAHAREENAL